jgi:hypothetical protein
MKAATRDLTRTRTRPWLPYSREEEAIEGEEAVAVVVAAEAEEKEVAVVVEASDSCLLHSVAVAICALLVLSHAISLFLHSVHDGTISRLCALPTRVLGGGRGVSSHRHESRVRATSRGHRNAQV